MKALCDECKGTGFVDRPYLALTVIPDLLAQTPKSVWNDYFANGYTLREAISEELSYA